MSARVAVAGMGLYCPAFPTLGAWKAGQRAAQPAAPSGQLLDKRSLRRASALTKAFADAYREALLAAQLDPVSVGSVFGSALGEAATMIGLLDQMWRETGALSPMRFATSVHNAAAGVVSISTHNRGFTTSLGADYDTPAMALLEGMGLVLTQGQPVIVACADEAAPLDLVADGQGWGFVSCAVALVDAGSVDEHLPRLSAPYLGEATLACPDWPPELARNPQAGLLDLVAVLCQQRRGVLRLDRGRGRGYCLAVT